MFSWFLRTHQILVHPDDGHLLLSAIGFGQLIHFDLQTYLAHDSDGLYEQLSKSGRKPCMIAFEIPDVPVLTTHSVTLDKFGNLWFTSWSGPTACGNKTRPPSVGFINRAWNDMVYFDHLRLELQAPFVAGPLLCCSRL